MLAILLSIDVNVYIFLFLCIFTLLCLPSITFPFVISQPLYHIPTLLKSAVWISQDYNPTELNYSDLLLSICYLALTLPLFCSHIHFTLILCLPHSLHSSHPILFVKGHMTYAVCSPSCIQSSSQKIPLPSTHLIFSHPAIRCFHIYLLLVYDHLSRMKLLTASPTTSSLVPHSHCRCLCTNKICDVVVQDILGIRKETGFAGFPM
jgi:hypothetical protein